MLVVGGSLLLGLLADAVGKRTSLPRATLLMLVGFAAGASGLNLLPGSADLFSAVAHFVLALVGFELGRSLTLDELRRRGRQVLGLSFGILVATVACVSLGLLLMGVPVEVALILAATAPATDPAACTDVIREAGTDGPFGKTLLGIVAVDDGWGIVAFTVLLAVAEALVGDTGVGQVLVHGVWELGGSVLLGVLLGFPLAGLAAHVKGDELTQLEALGAVFVCAGVAVMADLSFLLAPMVMGSVVANFSVRAEDTFEAVEETESPLLVLFFFLAGAQMQLDALVAVGGIGAAYVGLRVLGRLLGGVGGAMAVGAPVLVRRWMWLALMPQAGVALGLALVAQARFPEHGQIILTVVVGATVVFEVVGPVLTRLALRKAGEA